MKLKLVLIAFVAAFVLPAAASAQRTVSAFYYPWFSSTLQDDDYAHWSQGGHDPPMDIASVYYPAIGVYSSKSPVVLDEQMQEIVQAGINEIAVSWWGLGSPEDLRLQGVIAAAAQTGVSVAVHIEPYAGRTPATVLSDIEHLHTLGISTFYIYQAFNGIDPTAWTATNDLLHADGITTYAETSLPGQAATGHFSGLYTYDIVTWGAAKLGRICREAHKVGLLCAPSVGPGYDASRAGDKIHHVLRNDGRTYDSMWRAAIAAGADEVTITSFNEWQEGTQIEPAAPPARRGLYSYGSYNGAWGLYGLQAGAAYLNRTAYWAKIYRQTEPRGLGGP